MKTPVPHPLLGTACVVAATAMVGTELCGKSQYEYTDEAGAVTGITYVGGSDWLVAQEDPRSHWHKLPKLEWVAFHNFAVSGEALRYVLSLKKLKEFELGQGMEGVEVDTKDLDQLREADHLEYFGICLPDIGNDHLRFLPDMKRLETLSVEYFMDPNQQARFTDAVALHLVAAPNLRSIQIHSDEFTDEFIRLLSPKRELESLKIDSLHFTDTSLELIGQFANLKKLNIQSPKLTDEGVRLLSTKRELESLGIASHHFTDTSLELIGQFANLRELKIGSRKITGEGVRAMSGLVQLEKLSINSPILTGAALSNVGGLPKIAWLDLSVDEVEAEDLAALQKLKSLKTLALRSARIGDAEFAALRDHPSIETIFMGQAELTEKSLPVIESMKRLSYVQFETKTPESRQLLKAVAARGIKDGSFYPKEP